MASSNLKISLLLLRWSVALVMVLWAVDKLVNPGHGAAVFAGFYGLSDLGTSVICAVGIAQLVIIAGFVLGALKTWTYGAVLLMHAVTNIVSYKQYLAPYAPNTANLLFFAAIPMLAAAITLFLMRDEDTLLSLS